MAWLALGSTGVNWMGYARWQNRLEGNVAGFTWHLDLEIGRISIPLCAYRRLRFNKWNLSAVWDW